jgi:hypothetical protein
MPEVASLASGPAVSLELTPGLYVMSSRQDLFVINGIPQNVSSYTFLFVAPACNVTMPMINMSGLSQTWYQAQSAPNRLSVQLYHNICSWDQLTFRSVRVALRASRSEQA